MQRRHHPDVNSNKYLFEYKVGFNFDLTQNFNIPIIIIKVSNNPKYTCPCCKQIKRTNSLDRIPRTNIGVHQQTCSVRLFRTRKIDTVICGRSKHVNRMPQQTYGCVRRTYHRHSDSVYILLNIACILAPFSFSFVCTSNEQIQWQHSFCLFKRLID